MVYELEQTITTLTPESAETLTKSDLREYEDNIATFGNKTGNQLIVITPH